MTLVYPNQYSQLEQKMLTDTQARAQRLEGWYRKDEPVIATEFLLKAWANVVDCWNPLFNDSKYAADSKYQSIIAAPFFLENFHSITSKCSLDLVVPEELIPMWEGRNCGGEAEFLLPIHPGDSFKVKINRPQIDDITAKSGETSRRFRLTSSFEFVNQNGQVAFKERLFLENYINYDTVAAERIRAQKIHSLDTPNHYTEEDWAKIHEIEDAEHIYKNGELNWEMINPSDSIGEVIAGPTTVMDMVQFTAIPIMQEPILREQIRTGGKDVFMDKDGIYHMFCEGHYSSCGEEGRIPVHYMAYGRSLLARLITNFVSENGWVEKIEWKNEDAMDEWMKKYKVLNDKKLSTKHAKVGDVILGKGRIIERAEASTCKYLKLMTWCENLDGEITQLAIATVRIEN